MQSIIQRTLLIMFAFASLSSVAQYFRVMETAMKPADMPPFYIGAELHADKKYYYTTADGADSVILDSYTIYHYGKIRVFTLEGSNSPAVKPPHFKGKLRFHVFFTRSTFQRHIRLLFHA